MRSSEEHLESKELEQSLPLHAKMTRSDCKIVCKVGDTVQPFWETPGEWGESSLHVTKTWPLEGSELWVELCLPPNSYVEVLTSSTSEPDLIWK